MDSRQSLIEVTDLKTHFFTDEGVVKAVDGVDFVIPKGKTVCVVGESGSGKSITARSLLQLVSRPGRIVEGHALYHQSKGAVVDLANLDPRGREIRKIRGKEIAIIFQEPMTSLSPVHTIGDQIIEAITLHLPLNPAQAKARAIQMLERVGIPRPEQRMDSYAFELSGGMCQRVMIAMALSCEPRLLIADEPTTALDVTTQANILDLIRELQAEMGMSVMFITHDLGVVAEIADEVVVMYLGNVVESGEVDTIFHEPKHPYTKALLKSMPKMGLESRERLESIRGMVPHPFERPRGCPFHTRCDEYIPGTCDRINPRRMKLAKDHYVRCLLYDQSPESVQKESTR